MRKVFSFILLTLLISCNNESFLDVYIYFSSSSGYEVSEFQGGVQVIELNVTEKSNADIVINIEVAGTAEEGVDYVEIAENVTIPAGYVSVSIPIIVLDDDIFEGTEGITLSLSLDENAPSNVFLEESMFSTSITDDDYRFTLTWTNNAGVPEQTDLDLLLVKFYTPDVLYDISYVDSNTLSESIVVGGNYPSGVYGLAVFYTNGANHGAVTYEILMETPQGNSQVFQGNFLQDDYLNTASDIGVIFEKDYTNIEILN